MSRKKKPRNYYDVEQEMAVVAFLNAKTTAEKEKIYIESLREPINTMIDIIIRRYKLYRQSYEFKDIHADALSFLITKFDKFDPTKGNKSYSYFGTVCKNYLINELDKENKKNMSQVAIDDSEPEYLQRDDLLYRIDEEQVDLTAFIDKLTDKIKDDLKHDDLTDNEFKVGHALIKILEDWKDLFYDTEGKNSSKFNKNLILLYIRDMTGLTTKEIRNSMKRFKSLYSLFKNNYLDE
jgi:hypothetical protein